MAISLNAAIDLNNYSVDEIFYHANIDTFQKNRQQQVMVILEIEEEELFKPLTILDSLL